MAVTSPIDRRLPSPSDRQEGSDPNRSRRIGGLRQCAGTEPAEKVAQPHGHRATSRRRERDGIVSIRNMTARSFFPNLTDRLSVPVSTAPSPLTDAVLL
jgi:hypothetical protein